MKAPATDTRQTNSRIPTVRPVSWVATIPQFLTLMVAGSVGWLLTESSSGVFLGAAVYLTYSIASRLVIPSAHRRGVRLMRSGRFEEAIEAYTESYAFFTRHAWLDRYRSLTMMSPSAISYREMALINMAVAYSQIDRGDLAKAYYARALEEFPNSAMAATALKMIEAIEHASSKGVEAK